MHQKHNLVLRATALTNVLHGAMVRHGLSCQVWSHAFAPAHLRDEAMNWHRYAEILWTALFAGALGLALVGPPKKSE